MNERVFIVEDEEKIATLLRDYLHQAGYIAKIIMEGNTVVSQVRRDCPDLILMDLMLPGVDGFDLCKEIRTFSGVPIIIITARVDEINRLIGLELGADDYICKPCSPREVVARVKTVLRRTGGRLSTLPGRQMVLDESRQAALVGVNEVKLTTVEFRLLSLLCSTPGRIYTRAHLMDRIYPNERTVCNRTIDSHVKKLRKKLDLLVSGEEIVHSVYGVGYKFEMSENSGRSPASRG